MSEPTGFFDIFRRQFHVSKKFFALIYQMTIVS